MALTALKRASQQSVPLRTLRESACGAPFAGLSRGRSSGHTETGRRKQTQGREKHRNPS